MSERRRRGRVELATARSIREIGELPRGLAGLAESALTLAKALDDGAGLATAAVARELRATLTMLAKGTASDSNGDAVAELVARLGTPMPAEMGHSAD